MRRHVAFLALFASFLPLASAAAAGLHFVVISVSVDGYTETAVFLLSKWSVPRLSYDVSCGPVYQCGEPSVVEAAESAGCDPRALERFVKERINYAPSGIQHYPVETLESGEGDCDDMAFLLASMLRSCGIPAYVVGGLVLGGGEQVIETANMTVIMKGAVPHAWVIARTRDGFMTLDPAFPYPAERVPLYVYWGNETLATEPEPKHVTVVYEFKKLESAAATASFYAALAFLGAASSAYYLRDVVGLHKRESVVDGPECY